MSGAISPGPGRAGKNATGEGGAVWSRQLADEFWSGAVTPLTFSLLAPPMEERMVREPLRRAGVRRLAAMPILRLERSHVYANASLVAAVVALLPGSLRSEGLLAVLPPELRAELGRRSLLVGGARAALIALRFWLREPAWPPWRRAAAFDAAAAAIPAALASAAESASVAGPGTTPDPATAVAEMGRVRERLGDYLAVVSWGVVFAYVFYHLAVTLVRRWAPNLVRLETALMRGIPGIASFEAHREALDLGRLLAADPAVAGRLTRDGPATVAALLAAADDPIGRALRTFLERHGHRLSGRDLRCPTWREAPGIVIGLAARTGGGGARDGAEASARRLAATATITEAVGHGPGGQTRRRAFLTILALAQRYYAVRENMRYHADRFLARLRALALDAGGALVAHGVLESPEDVFFLTFDELAATAAGAPLVAPLTARRAAFDRDAVAAPPLRLGHEPPSLARPADSLAGELGAPGHCRAAARVVHDLADLARVAAGEIVVAAYTDPGWTPFLARAGGLVLEVGGALSHGAIVARELGLPALVGVAGALRAIADGDTLTLDAEAGRVTIEARAGGLPDDRGA